MVAVMIDGNGRRGRDAGNDGFLMDRGRDGCREGESGEASGDETRGRFVLIASDMSELVGSRWIWVWVVEACTGVQCGRSNLGVFEGDARVGR